MCLDEGKKDYTVPELEKATTCYRTWGEALQRRHAGLVKAVKEREEAKP